ncbi:MAG: class I SAM-dependent methyltransferase, partial [Actinobacteria bacterium]|nr:class I SAM-dependent methyltransferase [Actinomycetota bacterium]
TSALAVARGMGPEGRLLCCDLSEEWTAIARQAWEDAGVAERIELVLGPALDTIRGLPDATVFDFAFVDADKEGYLDYYEALLPRLRPGGLLLADNTLWSGRVIDPDDQEADTVAIREFNDLVANDPRVVNVVLTVRDGITLIRKA